MTTPYLIFDIVILLILAVFALLGAKRGLLLSLCGLLASLAGIIEVARLSSAQPTAGTGYELDAIAAVVLGGTSLAGGKGRIVGTLIGALILGFLNNGLNLLGVSSYYQMIVKAVVILLAVLVDNKKQ